MERKNLPKKLNFSEQEINILMAEVEGSKDVLFGSLKTDVVASEPGIQKVKDTDQDRSEMRSKKYLMFDESKIKGKFDVW